MPTRSSSYSLLARKTARLCGRPQASLVAMAIVILWIVSGPFFGFSDTWQLVINTGTTIVTFLMVFLIQHTQNTDTEAMHLKLDELIRATKGARNALMDLEELNEENLEVFRAKYLTLAKAARARENKPQ